jgi:transposase, IS30 family
MEKKYTQITQLQREEIYRQHADGISPKEIALHVDLDRSTIYRELKRNSYKGETYSPDSAHMMALGRRNRPGTKIGRSKYLQKFLGESLAMELSPQAISGRLALELGEHIISHESIYKWVYGEGKHLKLHKHLVRKKRKRGRRPCRKDPPSKIPNRVSIHDRPKEFETEFGHWEGDTVIFAGHKGALVTLYERQSKVTLAKKIERKTTENAIKAIEEMLGDLPKNSCKSITFDNGTEFTDHTELHEILSEKTFFCDPYSSWQKGGVENANGIIRRDIPKGSKACNYTDRDIEEIIMTINNTPRKSIGFLTPIEKFNSCFSKNEPVISKLLDFVALRI